MKCVRDCQFLADNRWCQFYGKALIIEKHQPQRCGDCEEDEKQYKAEQLMKETMEVFTKR